MRLTHLNTACKRGIYAVPTRSSVAKTVGRASSRIFRDEGTSSVVTLDSGAAETNDITHVDWQLSGPLKFLVTRAVVREIRDESLRNPARASTDREVDIRRPLDVTFVHTPPDLALTVSQLQFHGTFVHQA